MSAWVRSGRSAPGQPNVRFGPVADIRLLVHLLKMRQSRTIFAALCEPRWGYPHMLKRLFISTLSRITGVLHLCAVILFMALPSAAQSKTSVSNTGDVIRFDGVIDSASAAEFVSLLNERIKSVEIYSGGGEHLSAIHMGREIHARRLTLIVEGPAYRLVPISYFTGNKAGGETKLTRRVSQYGEFHQQIDRTSR